MCLICGRINFLLVNTKRIDLIYILLKQWENIHNNMLCLKTLRLIIIVCPREECCSFWTWLSKCSVIILKTRFFQLRSVVRRQR